MNDAKDIILQLLMAIDYNEDKDAFANEFLKNVQLQSFIDLLQPLPQDKQTQLTEQIADNSKNSEKVVEAIRACFSQEEVQKSFTSAFKKGFIEWFEAINPRLSLEQQDKLHTFL